MKKRERVLLSLGIVLCSYIASYLVLSINGRFEPEVIGSKGVMRYVWAPKGFVSDHGWRKSLRIGYFPLWIADTLMWHNSEEALSGKYPVSTDIRKFYNARPK